MYQNDVRPTVNIGEIKYLSSAGGSHFQADQQILKLADRGGVLNDTAHLKKSSLNSPLFLIHYQ